ncbi:hypothetical protein [Campylobacter devanensis]|uniref:hypothetical protein n=1 Tax=Campylobacter devanensis TaxID=3161138 RepID=UPI000A331A75|nr:MULTISPECIES: hypothetical protein [unclassified Campylobacter]
MGKSGILANGAGGTFENYFQLQPKSGAGSSAVSGRFAYDDPGYAEGEGPYSIGSDRNYSFFKYASVSSYGGGSMPYGDYGSTSSTIPVRQGDKLLVASTTLGLLVGAFFPFQR